MDERLRAALREARSQPGDLQLVGRAVALLEQAGEPIPDDLDDVHVHPARVFSSQRAFSVSAELPDGTWLREAETPGQVELPPQRVWWVTPQPVAFSGPVLEVLREQQAPGVTLGRSRKAAALLPKLAGLPLRKLSLISTGSKDDALEALPELSTLREVDLSGCKVTAAGLAHLAQRAPHLLRLTLDNTKKVELDGLPSFELLRRLSLSRAGLTLKRIKALPELPQLTHLNLYGNALTPKALSALAPKLPGLLQLVCEPKDHHWEEPFLAALGQLQGLRALTVPGAWGGAPEGGASLAPLGELSELRYLDLDVRYVADPSALTRLQRLRTLILCSPSDAALDAALELPGLRTLALQGCRQLSPQVLERAAAAEQLQRLHVGGFWWVNDSEEVNARRRHDALLALQGARLERLYLAPEGNLVLPNPEGLVDPDFPHVEQVLHQALPRPSSAPPSTRGGTPWVSY